MRLAPSQFSALRFCHGRRSPQALRRMQPARASIQARSRGTSENGVIAFKGIPLAQPPVGALRWRPPQPVKPWSGVRRTANYGADCMQVPFPGDAAPLG